MSLEVGFFVRLDTFQYVLVSLTKVMVPINEVNVTHLFYFYWGELRVLFAIGEV